MIERFSAIVTTKSTPRGEVVIIFSAVHERKAFDVIPSTVMLWAWREGSNVIRVGLRDVASGVTAHLQGSEELVKLLGAIGFAERDLDRS